MFIPLYTNIGNEIQLFLDEKSMGVNSKPDMNADKGESGSRDLTLSQRLLIKELIFLKVNPKCHFTNFLMNTPPYHAVTI